MVEPLSGKALEASSSLPILRNRVQWVDRFEQFPVQVQKLFKTSQEALLAFYLLFQEGDCRLLFCDFLYSDNEKGEEEYWDLTIIPLKLRREDVEARLTLLINLYDPQDRLKTPEEIFQVLVAGQNEMIKILGIMLISEMAGSPDN